MKPLYQLVTQHRALEALDAEEVDEQTLANTLEALEGEIEIKATSCAAHIQNLDAFAEMVKDASAKLAARAARIQRKSDWLRSYLLNQMRGAGISKIKAPEFTVSIRKNPASVLIGEHAAIPTEYMVQPAPPPARPDKKKLKEALERGTVIDGVALEQTERLDIRS